MRRIAPAFSLLLFCAPPALAADAGCGDACAGVSFQIAGAATNASRASTSQTQRNSARYRYRKDLEARENRRRVRALGRIHRNKRHQPGGYCMYDANGNVILRPEGAVCEGEGEYLQSEGGDAPASLDPGRTGCIAGSCRDGRGTYVWSNGSQYSGEFQGGRQNGQGTLLLPDGSSYVGEWRAGMRHGQGTATYVDGTVKNGYWEKNRFVGSAPVAVAPRIRWPDLSKLPSEPVGGGRKDAAVVVGISSYANVAPIHGAADNATDWYDYLVKTREIPVERVALLVDEDATIEEMRDAARTASRRVRRGGTLWFVFVGHGAPSRDGKDGLLVGFDAQQKARSIESRSLRRSELLALLQDSKAKRIEVLLDACFSGRTPGGEQLVAGLQPLVVTSLAGETDPRTILFTAAHSDEYAGPLPGADRPAFSYLSLGALRGWADADEDGRITSGELHAYVSLAMSALVRDRRQRPMLEGDEDARLAKSSNEAGPDLAKLIAERARR